MNKIGRSQRGLSLLYSDFVQKASSFHWEKWAKEELVALLRECVRYEERTAEAYSILKEIIRNKPIHILVFNDYLARRDYGANLSIYTACGLTCGYIEETSDFSHRKAAYSCNVVYVSAKEAAFDYLRDFLYTEKEQLLFHAFSAKKKISPLRTRRRERRTLLCVAFT